MEDKNKMHEQEPEKKEVSQSKAADPQEKMEGPVSSSIKKTGEAFETSESKKDANERHDERW